MNFTSYCTTIECSKRYRLFSNEKSTMVQLEMPGFKKSDICISVLRDKHILCIKADTPPADSKNSKAVHRSFKIEFNYMPEIHNVHDATSIYEDGILTITVPIFITSPGPSDFNIQIQ